MKQQDTEEGGWGDGRMGGWGSDFSVQAVFTFTFYLLLLEITR